MNGTRRKSIGVDPCSIDGCVRLVKALGMCNPHWKAFHAWGDPLATAQTGRTCEVCGAEFLGRGRTVTCSPDCSYEHAKVRNRRVMAAKRLIKPTRPPVERTEAICGRCGSAFMADRRRRSYCSADCFQADLSRANYVNVLKRRERESAVIVERFRRSEIFERDQWTCQICREPIDRTLTFPHPMYVNIDHIIPISMGGIHSRENVQTCHAICNARKGISISV